LPRGRSLAIKEVVFIGCLTGLDDAQIARLLVAGEFCDNAVVTTLAEENRALDRLFLICARRATATVMGAGRSQAIYYAKNIY
jgi:hypothetical protein